ncbi:DUF445 domain-containing protein [Desulfosporosinus sp. PR]|uniref:DUF445 domain-containing protein n=1 Tax=Candidatus Desulfosporosinus nitrosoreducens TaxID=3401928 RepID=UPI0027F399B8|nr:DUF445 domain-containing protein [Desulfosporosinus sp. PR]MDQ7095592.1 DUF445 domain-containing protein [Desulfosporosinus sp. PR]
MNYRKKANITLAAVFACFLSAALLKHSYPDLFGLQLLYFVLEAALVGGIADWFAVTAIFKKPLGWGYHTALIPRNRVKLIEGVAAMVQTELLHMDLIRRKVSGIAYLDGLIRAVERRGGPAYLTERAVRLLQQYAEKQDPVVLTGKLVRFLRHRAKEWLLAPKIDELSRWALDQGYIDQGLDRLAEGLWEKAAEGETRQVILKYLEGVKAEKLSNGGSIFRTLLGFAEMSDGLNMEEAADALHIELLLTLRKFSDRQDPLRTVMKESLLKGIGGLISEPLFRAQVEVWKEDLLQEELSEEFLTRVLRIILKDAASLSDSQVLRQALSSYIRQGWDYFLENKALQAQLNSFIAGLLCQVIENEHDVIGAIVKETLTNYSDEDLNQFIEEKAGNDLQWIRINGSMIGGAVGVFLFLFLNFLYDPYVLPLLKALYFSFPR